MMMYVGSLFQEKKVTQNHCTQKYVSLPSMLEGIRRILIQNLCMCSSHVFNKGIIRIPNKTATEMHQNKAKSQQNGTYTKRNVNNI